MSQGNANKRRCLLPLVRGEADRRRSVPTTLLAVLAGAMLVVLTLLPVLARDTQRFKLAEIDGLMARKDWKAAADLCRLRLMDDPTSADLALRLGICLSMEEKYDQARQVLDAAARRHPDDARIAYNRALVEYRAGNFDESLVRLKKVAKQAPYFPNVNYHIGRIYERKGMYDLALKAYIDELNISSSASAWRRYLILKRMRGARVNRPPATQAQPGP